MLGLQSNQLVGDGKQRQFQTRGNSSFVENVRQVPLHSFFADAELLGDITIAAAFHDAANHFQLTGRQAIGFAFGNRSLLHQFMEGANQVHHAFATNPIIARGYGPDGGGEVVGEGVLKHNAAGADLQRFDDLLGGDGAGEEQDLYCWRTTHDGSHCLQTGQTRHLQIKQKDVWKQFQRSSDGLIAIRCLADHVESGIALKHVFYADAHYRVVVGDDNTNL